MTVYEWLEKHPNQPLTVALGTEAAEALATMLAEPCARDVYVIDEDNKIVGHLSHIRLAQSVLIEHRPVHTRRQLIERIVGGRVDELMDPETYLARPDEHLDEVLSRQLSKQLEDLPVIDYDGRLLGAINLSEVLRSWCEAYFSESDNPTEE